MPLTINIEKLAFGILTKITNPFGIDAGDAISKDNVIIFDIKSYDKNQGYQVIYLQQNNQGEVVQKNVETEGVMPTFFQAPDHTIWMTLTSIKLDGIKEIVLPLENSDRIKILKSSREFPGDVVGVIGNQVILHLSSYDNSPDKLCTLFFDKNNLYQKRKIIKLDLPSKNKICVSQNKELQLLSYNFEKKVLIHRSIDSNGNLINSRTINTKAHHFGVISLCFNKISSLIITEGCSVFLVQVSVKGEVIKILLFKDTNCTDYFYNFWGTTKLNKDTYFIKFNHENGNGWAIVNDKGLLEVFLSKDSKYINPITNEIIDFGLKNPILNNAVGLDKAYHLSVTNSTKKEKNSTIVVLTRTI